MDDFTFSWTFFYLQTFIIILQIIISMSTCFIIFFYLEINLEINICDFPMKITISFKYIYYISNFQCVLRTIFHQKIIIINKMMIQIIIFNIIIWVHNISILWNNIKKRTLCFIKIHIILANKYLIIKIITK